MPNVYIQGVTRSEAAQFSTHLTGMMVEVLGVPPEQVHLIWRDSATFNNGDEIEGSVIVTLSWIRRSREWFERVAAGVLAILRDQMGVTRGVEVELHEKWDNAIVNGQMLSEFAAANPVRSRG